jgi:hypothetical protein
VPGIGLSWTGGKRLHCICIYVKSALGI